MMYALTLRSRPPVVAPYIPLLVAVAAFVVSALGPIGLARGATRVGISTKKPPSPRRSQSARSTPKDMSRNADLSSKARFRSPAARRIVAVPAPSTMFEAGSDPAANLPMNSDPQSVAARIVILASRARQAMGLAPLAVDDRLTAASEIQANAMASRDEMEHTLPGADLPTLVSRLVHVGFDYAWAGENIACNAFDPDTVVALWMDSPHHRDNILNPKATSIGVAVAYNNEGIPYFCQVLGRPR